jgi:ATP-dependent Zn protease
MVFDDAVAHAPALLFVDEIDAIAPRRGDSSRGTPLTSHHCFTIMYACLFCNRNGTSNSCPVVFVPGRFTVAC